MIVPLTAESVHLTFTGSAFVVDGATGWGFETAIPTAARIDLRFSTTLPGVIEPGRFGHYYSIDPRENFWRVRTGRLDLSMPLRLIEVQTNVIRVRTFTGFDGDLISLGAWIVFADPISREYALPVPPLPPVIAWDGEGGGPISFLDVRTGENFEYGPGRIIFTVEQGWGRVDTDFAAVPESSGWAWGAVGLAGAAMARKVINRSRAR